ncbi:MAG: SRPBCC family protein [Solirubrobacterales bacterium]
MPRVKRSRVIDADPTRVWDLVSDPHSIPRWYPRAKRVEDVRGANTDRAHWTTVLETDRGTGVRADFRCTGSTEPRRYAWEQELEGTPFDRVLRASRLEIGLAPDGSATEVTLVGEEKLRGLSRLGSAMMRGAVSRRLDDALDGIERALVGNAGG